MVIDVQSLRTQLTHNKRPFIYSVLDKETDVPAQKVLITQALLDSIQVDTIDAFELVQRGVDDTSYTVSSEFTSTALNAINSLYYSSCDKAFHSHSDLATLFVKNRMVQYTLLQLILSLNPKDQIDIKEICAGSVYTRWQHFSSFLPKSKSMKVTIADFTSDIVPLEKIRAAGLKRMDFESETYDLLKPFPSRKERLDVMLVTYGFDSVWDDSDVMYVGGKGKDWYQIDYRVRVSPESKKRDFLVESLRKGYTDEELTLTDFEDVFVESRATKVNISKVYYGEFVKKAYEGYDFARAVVPGLMVERVKEAFEKQIDKDGAFIIGEVGLYPLKPGEQFEMTVLDENITGKVGRFKVEDLYLAEMILKSEGFDVVVHDLETLAKSYGKKIEDDVVDTWVMVVRRG